MKPTGDEFEKLALDQLDTLYRFARRLTRDANRAEDLVQETYARAFTARDSFQLQEGFGIRPWLLRIMQNLHFSRRAREKRQPATVDADTLTAAAEAPGAEAGSAGALASALGPLNFDDLDGPLAQALDELPADYQTVLLLWAVEDLSYKEIAAVVDIPIGTVMSRLHRARQRLSERLRDYAVKEGVIRR